MNNLSKLYNYPKLADWFKEQKGSNYINNDPCDHLLLCTCQLLIHDYHPSTADSWCEIFATHFNASRSPNELFGNLKDILQKFDIPILSLLSDIGYISVINGKGETFLDIMSTAADKTQITALSFLAAWTALNINDLIRCIEECEKVDEPYASIHTIHGQALIEIGNIDVAIEVLEVAIVLAPTEILALFQLAKANHLKGRSHKCWEYLIKCYEIEPSSVEVANFMTLATISEKPIEKKKIETSWGALKKHLSDNRASPNIVTSLLDLAVASKSKERAKWVLDTADFITLYKESDFIKKISKILKIFKELEWFDLSKDFLDKMLESDLNLHKKIS